MIQMGSYQRAADTLCLDEPYSDEDLNKRADEYEKKFGIPLVRPHEEDRDGFPTEAFEKRLKGFNFKGTDTGVAGDPEVFRKEYKKLMSKVNKVGYAGLDGRDQRAIHECEKALGLPATDFTKSLLTPKEIAKRAEETYSHVQKHSMTYLDRVNAVKAIEDVATLEVFVEMDKSEDVRDVALARIVELGTPAVPEL